MDYTTLGGPGGARISTLCLGTLPFGTTVTEPEAFAILDRFREAGGTFLDTADCYSFWIDGATGRESEELVGRWLASRACRDEMVIATKAGAQPVPGHAGTWPRNAEGLSAPAVREAAEGSLRRLGVDIVDVLYAHIEDRAVEIAETVGAFGALIADGLIARAGVSNHPTSRIRTARAAARDLGVPGYTVVQQRHSVLRPRPGASFAAQEAADDELLDYIRAEEDFTLTAYSSLLNGAFSRADREIPEQYRSPANVELLRVLRQTAYENGVTPNQLALACLLRGTPAAVPVLGVSSVAQLDEALGALEVPAEVAAAVNGGAPASRDLSGAVPARRR